MLKAISVWALPGNEERPAEALFEEAARHGFQGIELAIGEKGLVTPATTRKNCRGLAERAEEAGVRIVSLASGLGWQYPMSADDPSVRARGVELTQAGLRAAAWLGVEVLLVVPGMVSAPWGPGEPHVPYDVAYDRMREGIADCVPLAEELGVVLAIENVWNRVLLSPLEMRAFADSFTSRSVGVYLDVGNMIVSGYAEDWVRVLGSRVRAVHFKDYRRSAGTLDGFCELLEGDVNYPAVMAALRAAEYDGACVAEFFRLDAAALDRVSAAMDRILAM